MRKSTINRVWIIGLIVLVAGLIVGLLGVGLMLAYGGQYVRAVSGNGYDFVPTINCFFWMTVSLMTVGFLVAAVGGVMQLAAWVGALVNTYQLTDRTWFAILLAGGLLGLVFGLIGFGVMLAYVLAGPDGTAVERPQMPPPGYETPSPTPAT
jgi:hypothetical protein